MKVRIDLGKESIPVTVKTRYDTFISESVIAGYILSECFLRQIIATSLRSPSQALLIFFIFFIYIAENTCI